MRVPFPIAPVLFIALALLPLSACAQSASKAPAGSRNGEIELVSFCLGQTMARIPKLTDALNKAEGESSVYLAQKAVEVYRLSRWMYAATVATLKSVENPDSEVFTNSKAKGEKMGADLFEIEDECLGTCATSNVGANIRSCVDSCVRERNVNLYTITKLCETLQARLQAGMGDKAHAR